jgi:hypothetical protein
MDFLVNWTGGRGLDSSGRRQGQVTARYEHGDVLSGFIKGDICWPAVEHLGCQGGPCGLQLLDIAVSSLREMIRDCAW